MPISAKCIETVVTALKKKRQNRNGKLGVNKVNEYAYVPNAPRKGFENCSSSNHLTHACKKPVIAKTNFPATCSVPDELKGNGLCDKFDCMPCNINVMNNFFMLRK